MHARRGAESSTASHRQRRLDALKHRCLQHAQHKRHDLLSTRRLSAAGHASTGEGDQMVDDTMQWREIVQAELNSVARNERGAPSSFWTEADEAALQRQLGPDGYLELMAATEEMLLRELQSDVAYLGGTSVGPDTEGSSREYEAFLAQEEATIAACAEDIGAMSGEIVLCPLCMRGTLQLLADGTIVSGRSAADGGGCTLRLDSRGHPAPLEALRELMCALLTEHGQQCQGFACCRLPTPQEQAAGAAGALLLACPQCGADVPVV